MSYRYLSATQLFSALRDTGLADRIRLRSAGTTLLITSAAADASDPLRDCLQLLMTEVLARASATTASTACTGPTARRRSLIWRIC